LKKTFSELVWLIKGSGKKLYLSLFLYIFLGLFQGVGLVILVPLLSITGLKSIPKVDSKIVDNARYFFQAIHVNVSFVNVLIFFVLIIIFYATLKYFSSIVNTSISQDYSNNLRKRLHRAILKTEWITIVKVRSSDLIGLLSREIQQVSFGVISLTNLLGTLILLLIHILMAFIISWKVSLFIMGVGFLLFIMQRKILTSSLAKGKQNKKMLSEIQKNLQELFLTIKITKSQNLTENQLQNFDSMSDQVNHNFISFNKSKAISDFSYDVGSSMLIAGFLFFIYRFYDQPVIDLLMLVYIYSRILPGVKSCSSSFQTVLNNLPIAKDVRKNIELFENNIETDFYEGSKKVELNYGIKVENLFFAYNESKQILKNASFFIEANKVTMITGKSGIGKSTFADILIGLLKPTSGTISVDNKSLSEIGYASWRSQIAYMSQERFLFNDSIRNNLLWSNPNASEIDMWEALERVQAKNYVESLRFGLDTVVGDRGIHLSGGQRQRIALAMALIRKPKLLILDEATNELDEITENEIYKHIFELKNEMTIFVITHRLASLRYADKVYLFENGGVSEKYAN
jgi:ABC-type multidrug transport system fused ATPase/permease subunit